MTLRHGPSEPGRVFNDVSSAEIEHLASAHGAFVEVAEENQVMTRRFMTEASATLPSIGEAASLDDIFSAVSLQQVRLRNDQQIPIWEPKVD